MARKNRTLLVGTSMVPSTRNRKEIFLLVNSDDFHNWYVLTLIVSFSLRHFCAKCLSCALGPRLCYAP